MADDPYAPLVQDAEPLNEVKYAARDYPTINDSLLRRLKLLYLTVYNDFASTVQGTMFLELMAYAIAQLQWFLDRTASDSFLKTSRTAAATSQGVEQIGYKMASAAASGTTLTLGFPDGTTDPFVMQARWRYQGPNNLQFESYAEKVISTPGGLAPGEEITVDVRQGESRLLSYTSDGSKNQTYRLTNVIEGKYLAVGSAQVWVDGSEWEENDFLEYEKTNQFEVSYLADPPLVRFGDGSAGNVPPASADIKIRFLIIAGEDGNVNANTIESSIDTLYIAGEKVTFTVDNASGSTGGVDPEDIDRAKRIAPFSFAARGAAITQPDYEALSQSFVSPTYGSPALSWAFNPRAAYDDIIFNTYIAAVNDLVEQNAIDATTLEVAISTAAASVSGNLDWMDVYLDRPTGTVGLEQMRLDLYADVDSARTYTQTAKDGADTSLGQVDAAVVTLTDFELTVDGWGSSSEKTQAQAFISTMKTQTNAARASIAMVGASLTTAMTKLSTAYARLVDTPVPDWPESTMYSLIQLLGDQVDAIRAAFETPITGLQALADDNVGAAEALEADVVVQLGLMHSRIGELFNADCLSNYVQVPILALDFNGNYAAPSVGLRTELQTYLNGIKEVTQQVEVIDGSSILVPAEITIDLRISEVYVDAEVQSKVDATVVGMLKGRSFDSPLYLSDLYENVKASSGGITYTNITIDGPTEFLADGNLVPGESKVIVYGTLTFNILES